MFPSLRRVAVAADLIAAETRIYILYYNAGGRSGYGGLRVPNRAIGESARARVRVWGNAVKSDRY